MKKLTLLLIPIILLVSCAPQDPVQKQEIVVIDAMKDLITQIEPECSPSSDAPVLVSPLYDIIDPSAPHTFSWTIDCDPFEYYMEVYPNEDSPTPVIANYFQTSGEQTTVNVALLPATTYLWHLTAFTAYGESLHSNVGSFATGPVCGAGELVPPTLVSPADGSIDSGKGWGYLDEVHTTIKYPLGACIPNYFEIDLSKNADFSGADSWNIGGPAGHFGTIDGSWLVYGDDTNVLDDCDTYYWRARAVTGPDHSNWSETWSFYLDVYDSCFLIPEFSCEVIAIAKGYPYCRSGPGSAYAEVTDLKKGDTVKVVGISKAGTFYLAEIEGLDEPCWLWRSLLEIEGDTSCLPVSDEQEKNIVPEEEVDEPAQPAPQQGCIAPDASGALVCQVPCPNPKYASRVCQK